MAPWGCLFLFSHTPTIIYPFPCLKGSSLFFFFFFFFFFFLLLLLFLLLGSGYLLFTFTLLDIPCFHAHEWSLVEIARGALCSNHLRPRGAAVWTGLVRRKGWLVIQQGKREAPSYILSRRFWAVQLLPPPLDVIARIGKTKKVKVQGGGLDPAREEGANSCMYIYSGMTNGSSLEQTFFSFIWELGDGWVRMLIDTTFVAFA
ncbi:hypothetical protein HDV57DRAFT_46958 [Trichoderma longibrachiatum]